jgi:tetratricopeptide (TPR) repeat protein
MPAEEEAAPHDRKPAAGGTVAAPAGIQRDFFISRRGASAAVAQEVAEVLIAADYSVLLQDYDIPHGDNFVVAMHEALKLCRHFIALLSEGYDSTPFTTAEWSNFYVIAAQSGGERRFIVLRVDDCNPEGLFSAVVFGDLVGIHDPQERRARILAAAEGRAGAAASRPRLFANVPPPDLNFTGRETALAALHDMLMNAAPSAPTRLAAVCGLGGIGKTSLAAEYAHRHAESFGGVWWAPAQERTLLVASLAALGARLDPRLSAEPDQERVARAALSAISARSGLPFLLVYDNAEAPDPIRDLVPTAGARVLLTTRWADWGGQAAELKLDALAPAAAAAFLEKRAMRNDGAGAARLAAALGYLPLALDHAGAFCRLSRTGFDAYVGRIESRIAKPPKGYPASVAATFALAVERVAAECPAAEALLAFCAFLAPDDIPLDLVADEIPDEEERAEAMMALSAVSLIEQPNLGGDQPSVSVHRLVQAAMRARLAEKAQAQPTLARVMQKLETVFPPIRFGQITVASRRVQLMPHVLAARECFHAIGVQVSPEATRLFDAAGWHLEFRGDYAAAERLLRDAIAIGERTHGGDHHDIACALHNLALLCLHTARRGQAEPLIARAIAMIESTLGGKDADEVTRLNMLGNLLSQGDRKREAAVFYRQAIAMAEELDGPEHGHIAGLLNNLAHLLRTMGDDSAAEASYRRAIAIGVKAFGVHNVNVARHTHNLANLLRVRRRHAEAEPLYRDAIASLTQALGEDSPLTARAKRNFAMLLLASRRAAEALPYAEAAFRAHSSAGIEARWASESARTYAQALSALGRKAQAAAVTAAISKPGGADKPRDSVSKLGE